MVFEEVDYAVRCTDHGGQHIEASKLQGFDAGRRQLYSFIKRHQRT